MSDENKSRPCPACAFVATMTPERVSDMRDVLGFAYVTAFAQSPIENPKNFCERHLSDFSRALGAELEKNKKASQPKFVVRLTDREAYEVGLQVMCSESRDEAYARIGRYIGADNAAKIKGQPVQLEKVATAPSAEERVVPYEESVHG